MKKFEVISGISAEAQQIASGMETGAITDNEASKRLDNVIASLQEAKHLLEEPDFDSDQFQKDDPITQAEKLLHLKQSGKLKTKQLAAKISDGIPFDWKPSVRRNWVKQRLSLLNLKKKTQEKVRKGDLTFIQALKKAK